MNCTRLLVTITAMLTASPTFAQFGGMGGVGGGPGGGMGAGMGGMGGGMMGATTPSVTMMGGRTRRAEFAEVTRSARIEMEGAQVLSGKVDLRPVIVDGDLGQYVIPPDKIKVIRFLKAVDDGKPADGAEPNANGQEGVGVARLAVRQGRVNRAGVLLEGRGGGDGLAFVPDPESRTATAVLIRGKVVTTGDKEVIGFIHIPGDFQLDLDFGSLTLAPVKLRSITFTDDYRKDKPAQAEAAATREREGGGEPSSVADTSPPRYLRAGRSVIVISPIGERVMLYSLDTKKSESLELSGTKDAPLDVNAVLVENVAALILKGQKVTQIAVADTGSGTWHSQRLLKPLDDEASPLAAHGVVVYKIGRDVYAYGTESQRWDVVELPEGVRAMPVVGSGSVTIESHGHIYTFAGKTGRWDHIDVRRILDGAMADKK